MSYVFVKQRFFSFSVVRHFDVAFIDCTFASLSEFQNAQFSLSELSLLIGQSTYSKLEQNSILYRPPLLVTTSRLLSS